MPIALQSRKSAIQASPCGTDGAFCLFNRTKQGTDGTQMSTQQVVWHGSQQESFDLVNAIARNCTCEFGLMGVRIATCAPHRMLTEDQRALNGLLFARRMADRLRREEFSRARTANTASTARTRGLAPLAAD
jgi:hypothetical protein